MNTRKVLLLGAIMAATPLTLLAAEFFSQPELLKPDSQYGNDQIYLVEGAFERLAPYQNIMVDEPIIFIAEDSPYTGFKASDLAEISAMMREGFTKGLQEEPMQSGNLKVVEQAGPNTLYMRIGIQNLYIRKNKRGLLAYTPVGAVAHGVTNAVKDSIDKTTLVEMQIQGELLDSQTGEVLAAISIDLGQRKDKATKTDEDAAGWEATGAVSEVAGRRVACRLDNARHGERRDCVNEIPIPR